MTLTVPVACRQAIVWGHEVDGGHQLMGDQPDMQFRPRDNASRNGWTDCRHVKADPKFITTGGEHKGFWILGPYTRKLLGIEA